MLADRPDNNQTNSNPITLSLEKQLAHRAFSDAINKAQNIEELRKATLDLHLLYLRQQQMFSELVRGAGQ